MEPPRDYQEESFLDEQEPVLDLACMRYAILISVALWIAIIGLIVWWV